jgi:hypothetical protein
MINHIFLPHGLPNKPDVEIIDGHLLDVLISSLSDFAACSHHTHEPEMRPTRSFRLQTTTATIDCILERLHLLLPTITATIDYILERLYLLLPTITATIDYILERLHLLLLTITATIDCILERSR